MKEKNVYRIIVWAGVAGLAVWFFWGKLEAYWIEERIYGMRVFAERDLTEEILEEFQKLPGLCSFEPVWTVTVTVVLDSFSMEGVLEGVEMEKEEFRFSSFSKEVCFGNTLILLVGEEFFDSLADKDGNPPLKSQSDRWRAKFEELEVTVTDESGEERKAKIGGILEEQGNRIFVDCGQMREAFGKKTRVKGGYIQVFGQRNLKKTRKVLEGAGFLAEEDGAGFLDRK